MGDNNKAKTKSAMLNELESIKGLLLEDDDIPILQEVIDQHTDAADPQFVGGLALDDEFDYDSELDHELEADDDLDLDTELNVEEELATNSALITPASSTFHQARAASTTGAQLPAADLDNKLAARVIVEQQQDFFSSIQDADTAEELLDSLDNLEAKTSRITAHKTLNDRPTRPSLAKPVGENPFLPEHIRARLHGNNPPPLFASETARKIAHSSKPMTQLGSTQPSTTQSGSTQSRFASHRPTSLQQELIDSIVAQMLPDMEKELRQRLESMSRSMLDELSKH